MKTGTELIAIERQEQIEKHGYNSDLGYVNNELLQATVGLLGLPKLSSGSTIRMDLIAMTPPTNWDKHIWKNMCSKSYKDRLVIAGALIAAEIDRLQEEDNLPKH